jgi:putative intracellular protease/amidase
MPKADEYIFVLWGSGFDEATATIFVTELRRAGLRVKVVGLTRRRSGGAYGLVLEPDLTLEQALPLAASATCLVIPYSSSGNQRLANDPRLSEFFDQAQANQARFVIGPMDEADLSLLPADIDKVVVDLDGEDLIRVARGIARLLSGAMQMR